MMYLNDFEKELFNMKKHLLLNPMVKSDLSNVLVSVEIKDGNEYLHYHLEEEMK